MKKIINISVIAALAILPLAAHAEDYPIGDPTAANPATAAGTGPGWALAQENSTADGKLATAGYVKGAYNQTMKAINKVATTAGNAATQSLDNINTAGENVIKGLAADGTYDNTDSGLTATTIQDAIDEVAGTASFAGTESELNDTHFASTDKTSAAKAANAAMAAAAAAQADVDAVETTIGNTTLTTTSQTLTGAIEEVKGTASFAGTASELNDSNFDAADKTSAAKAANAAMAAAAAAQADVDAVETTIGNTTLTTTSQTLTGAIEEVKAVADAAVTDADIADFATQDGVENTIKTATINANVPIVTTWGTDTETTLGVNVASISATYAEPTPTPAP